jgi:uncharacterized LabA/DUF88 family protein
MPDKLVHERVIVYIDGFNLYFGMKEAGFNQYRWLDLTKLVNNFLKANQTLEKVKYFTSKVRDNPDKLKRQTTFIEAQQTKGVEIFYGKYQLNTTECHICHNVWISPSEKMTDVNIATQMLVDAYSDKFDVAILISGDSDLVPPIRAINDAFNNKNKRVTVLFPPKRFNNSVSYVAKGSEIIGRKRLKDSQLEDRVKKADGYILTKPIEWINSN